MFVGEQNGKQEVDHYWEKLTADGGVESMCGWLRDKYGVSWQITPVVMRDLLQKSPRVMEVMFWGDYFGSFRDRYGIWWMINFPLTQS
ncbi:MAG: VOC family protein [Porphyromonadaceae bacterium]|nr:VOC family protein [Porphyromonadaceae bacterium]